MFRLFLIFAAIVEPYYYYYYYKKDNFNILANVSSKISFFLRLFTGFSGIKPKLRPALISFTRPTKQRIDKRYCVQFKIAAPTGVLPSWRRACSASTAHIARAVCMRVWCLRVLRCLAP